MPQLRKLYKTTHLDTEIEKAVNNQVMRIQTEASTSKNSRLYLSLLLETKDLEESLVKLLRIIFDATKNMEIIPEPQLKESIDKIKEQEKAEKKTDETPKDDSPEMPKDEKTDQ